MKFQSKILILIFMGILGSGCIVRESRHATDYHRYRYYSRDYYHQTNRKVYCPRCDSSPPGQPAPHHIQLHPGNPPSMTIFPPSGGRYTIVMSEEDLYRLEDNLIEWRKYNGTLLEEGATSHQDR